MRRIVGPILTTGVALVAASVVVANPIVVPRADVQIPAFKLSAGNDETGGMLDPAFLNAIAPAPSESDNPFVLFKQLITSFATDATSVGRNAIVEAFVAGVAAVSQPELTAASIPYVPSVAPALDLPDLTQSFVPGLDISALVTNTPVAMPDPASVISSAATPLVEDFVSSLVADVSYVGSGLVAVAFAAGAVVAAEPKLIVDTLDALVNGDINGALEAAVKALVAPIGPPAMLVQVLRDVVEKYLEPVPGIATGLVPRPVPSFAGIDLTQISMDIGSATGSPATASREKRQHRVGVPAVSLPVVAVAPSPAAALGAAAARSESAAAAPRKAIGAARGAVAAIGEQAGAAVADAADAVGKIAAGARGARAARG